MENEDKISVVNENEIFFHAQDSQNLGELFLHVY